jgi:hypothetical protein
MEDVAEQQVKWRRAAAYVACRDNVGRILLTRDRRPQDRFRPGDHGRGRVVLAGRGEVGTAGRSRRLRARPGLLITTNQRRHRLTRSRRAAASVLGSIKRSPGVFAAQNMGHEA